jgi:pimeloyl-ACP methyl ester carboxylesterase
MLISPDFEVKLPGPKTFNIHFEDHVLTGDLITEHEYVSSLILHGGGGSSRSKIRFLRERLFEKGISSCAFDFIGHGDTGGNLKSSSLLQRTQQACSVIESQPVKQPLTVIGASMGAYTAVKLISRYPVENLVLLVPAMYAAEAYSVPFNDGFTSIIRRPNSWEHSDAWELLADFTGALFIVAAEFDRVIPRRVIEKIYSSATRARKKELYTAPGVSHFVFTELRAKNPKAFEHVLNMMVDTINRWR